MTKLPADQKTKRGVIEATEVMSKKNSYDSILDKRVSTGFNPIRANLTK
jgi:hypothetical protein